MGTVIHNETEEQWLEARRIVVTSTGLAPLMQIPGAYGSPISEFLDKLGKSERTERPEFIEWGRRLQQTIGIAYSEREGKPIDFISDLDLYLSSTSAHLGASLDVRLSGSDQRCIDCKNVGYADPEKWGEQYTAEIPAPYVVQLHGQMEVTETAVADLAVLFGGRKLAIYRVERDEEIIAACREVARDFMTDHVEPAREALKAGGDWMRYAPPIDGSDEWTKFLNSRKQRFDKYLDVATLPEDQATVISDWAQRLEAAKAAKTAAELEESTAGNHLRAIIGEHAGVIGPFGRIHYKRSKDKVIYNLASYVGYLERIVVKLGGKPMALARVKQRKFTSTEPGNRPLLPKFKKEERDS